MESTKPLCQTLKDKEIKLKERDPLNLERGTVDIDDDVTDEQIQNLKTTD